LRSSLEELLLDFEDFLRHRRLPQWAPESPQWPSAGSAQYKERSDRSVESTKPPGFA
jgi:hypothetical protein